MASGKKEMPCKAWAISPLDWLMAVSTRSATEALRNFS